MLRVLFAKMNGTGQGVNKGTMRNMQMQQYALLRQQHQDGGDMPQPVFLSEGADLPASAGAAEFQGELPFFCLLQRVIVLFVVASSLSHFIPFRERRLSTLPFHDFIRQFRSFPAISRALAIRQDSPCSRPRWRLDQRRRQG